MPNPPFIRREGDRLVRDDGARAIFAHLTDASILDEDWTPPPDAGRVVVSSATHADGPGWALPGWEGLQRACERLSPALAEDGASVCVRPHAADVLCDWPRARAWLEPWAPRGFELLLDPVAWLTPGMLPLAADHLERIFDRLGDAPGVAGVVLTGARVEGDRVVPCPLGEGALEPGAVLELLAASPAAGLPIVLPEGPFEPQRALVERARASATD